MNKFWPLLRNSIRATATALLISVFVIGLSFGFVMGLIEGFESDSLSMGLTIGLTTVVFAMLLGAVPAILFGGVSYSVLLLLNRASYLSATLMGAVPGLVLALLGQPFALQFIGFGIPCAALTHYFYSRRAKQDASGR